MQALTSTNTQTSTAEGRWEAYKDIIHNLYIEQNKRPQGRGGVIDEMKATYGHNASKAQYERYLTKWGFKKKSSSHAWIQIAKLVRARTDAGKESEVIIHGVTVSTKKLKKEIQRYSNVLELGESLNEGIS